MSPTVQDVIDTIIATVPDAPLADSVDTVKTGDPSQKVTGIVTTFLATYAVIQEAAARGANLIITHEPTFYNHRDEIDWLQGDPVYRAKRNLIDSHDIVIWRFHDYWHMHRPDGILTGVLNQLRWEHYAEPEQSNVCVLPPTPVSDLVGHIQSSLGAGNIRLVGDPSLVCRRVGLMVGAPGGRWQIEMLSRQGIDLLICGEINEWETSEYVRDAIATGREVALLVIGHAASEEAGMAWLVDWLRERVPNVPVAHIASGNPLKTVD